MSFCLKVNRFLSHERQNQTISNYKQNNMEKKYLHPSTREFVSKEIYFKFILSKDFPKSPYSEKMK